MLRTLRVRAIVSHLVPVLLTLPLLRIVLIDAVETQVLLAAQGLLLVYFDALSLIRQRVITVYGLF
jgi:hypothetical protein